MEDAVVVYQCVCLDPPLELGATNEAKFTDSDETGADLYF